MLGAEAAHSDRNVGDVGRLKAERLRAGLIAVEDEIVRAIAGQSDCEVAAETVASQEVVAGGIAGIARRCRTIQTPATLADAAAEPVKINASSPAKPV